MARTRGADAEGAGGSDDACEREDDGCEVALLSRNVGELASVLSQLGKDVEKLEGMNLSIITVTPQANAVSIEYIE